MAAIPAWSVPGDNACREIAAGCVDIWRARIDLAPGDVSSFFELISADEQARADRFRYPHHRSRYIASHGILRKILGLYLDVPPKEICFAADSHGKPYLTAPCTPADLRFNLSHSRDMALYAVTRSRDVGIDVEHLERAGNSLEIARRFFAPAEADAIASAPDELRRKAFLTCWTRKEAFLKAKGDGLSIPLNAFEVTVWPESPPALLSVGWDASDHLKWVLFDIDPGGDYVASIAVEQGVSELRCFDADWTWRFKDAAARSQE